MKKVRILSDCHGNGRIYHKLINGIPYTLQIGDLGFNYDFLKDVDYNTNVAIFGNHDRFDLVMSNQYPKHFLSHGYGVKNLGGLIFFYISGAFSIDWKLREQKRLSGEWPRTWWEEEQLSYTTLQNAIDAYYKHAVYMRKNGHDIVVITHEAPSSISRLVGSDSMLRNHGYDPETFRTRTGEALQQMFEAIPPDYWFFGHFHTSFQEEINGCIFNCRKQEGGHVDLTLDQNAKRMEVLSIKNGFIK